MSLQVWLPLNGSLENKGVYDASFTNVGTTVSNEGKLGSCYYFNGSASIKINNPAELISKLQSNKITLSYWAKLTTSSLSEAAICVSIGTNATDNSLHAGFRAGLTPCLGFYSDDLETTVVCTANTWYHFACVVDGKNRYMYMNGTLIASGVSSGTLAIPSNGSIYIGNCGGAGSPLIGCLNDVRIYDNCLSASEVKDLAKGLVLHYPLNDTYIESTTNYLVNKTLTLSDWTSYGFGSRGSNTIVSGVEGVNGGQVCKVTDIYTNTSNISIEMATSFSATALTNGQKATFSVWVKGEGSTIGKTGGLHVYNSNGTNTQSDTVVSFTFTGEWQRVSGQFTWRNTAASSTAYNVYVLGNICKNEYYYFCNPQFELKDHATPYTPSSRGQSIVYDTSGYGNNGTYYGDTTALTTSGTNARYNNYTYFNSANVSSYTDFSKPAYIKANLNLTTPTALTVSFWCKMVNNYSSSGIFCFSASTDGLPSDYTTAPIHSYDATYRFNGANGSASLTYGEISSSKFTHVVLTYDGTTAKEYIDGNLFKSSTSLSGTLGSCSSLFIGLSYAGGAYRKIQAGYSDFRVYTTALSPEDIMDLYNAPIKVNKSGTLSTNGEIMEA